MSEKRVCSASRSFAPLIGLFAAPNRPRNAPNSKIPLRKPLFQADSMRLWRIHSAKGAFTLSIDHGFALKTVRVDIGSHQRRTKEYDFRIF